MTLLEFKLSDMCDKVSILYKHGVYIGKRREEHLTILLYQVDSFYVEIAYRLYRRYIARVRSSESTTLLDPYLEQIDVEHLVG